MVAYCSEVAFGHACPVKAKYTTSQWLITVTRSSLVRRRGYGEEWAFVAPYLTLMSPEASHRVYALREVVSVMRWIVRGEAPWRLLATNVPNTLREPPSPKHAWTNNERRRSISDCAAALALTNPRRS